MSAIPETDPTVSALCVERAIVELRRGRAIDIATATTTSVVAAIERLDADGLGHFAAADGSFRVVVTSERARSLGLDTSAAAVAFTMAATTTLPAMLRLATAPGQADEWLAADARFAPAGSPASAALMLMRHAQLVPAVLELAGAPSAMHLPRLSVSSRDIASYPQTRGRELQLVSRARVPLAGAEACEFIVYRERFGDAEHVAIVIGTPDPGAPVPVRLHSACLTGDLLASLRCDCGDQLRGAVARIAEAGGGYLLYLAQEGRGIGLANKLRAYALQEQGLNTLQADQQLGFRADERDFAVACAMLRDLEVERVVLLTNNPDKMAALNACDIEVVGRMPLPAPVNAHNARYMETKRKHAGHWCSETDGVE